MTIPVSRVMSIHIENSYVLVYIDHFHIQSSSIKMHLQRTSASVWRVAKIPKRAFLLATHWKALYISEQCMLRVSTTHHAWARVVRTCIWIELLWMTKTHIEASLMFYCITIHPLKFLSLTLTNYWAYGYQLAIQPAWFSSFSAYTSGNKNRRCRFSRNRGFLVW